jgi:hypothetical protein
MKSINVYLLEWALFFHIVFPGTRDAPWLVVELDAILLMYDTTRREYPIELTSPNEL